MVGTSNLGSWNGHWVFMSFHVLQLLSHILTVLQNHPIQLGIRLGPRQPIRFPHCEARTGQNRGVFSRSDPKTYYRRKFRSETSDNMDSWKAEVRRVRREKIRREKIRRERVRRKKMQMREKVGKSRFTVFFQWFVAPEGRKVGSLKRRCGSSWPDERWKSARRCGAKHISKSKCTKHTRFGPLLYVAMSKKCTPLWREAHFQVKMYKTHHSRTTFGSWAVEKVHAVVARSTFPSQKC